MKKGDKIIWDSHFGYELGEFVKSKDDGEVVIRLTTGSVIGEISDYETRIYPYSEKKIEELRSLYHKN